MLDEVLEIAMKAGETILEVYAGEDFGTVTKEGGSPLTLADSRANEVIEKGLKWIAPEIPILSEETEAEPYSTRRCWKRLWIVDPLDGTKEFIKRNGEFTVNIALVEDGSPILGVVYAPALGVMYYAGRKEGAFRLKDGHTSRIEASDYRNSPLKVVGSRSHKNPEADAFVGRLGEVEFVSMGSSLKFCLVADGSAHLYPRFGPTMEWDTAAAQCVVEAAGGEVRGLDGQRLTYNKQDLLNPFFIVAGNPPFPWQGYVVK